MSGYSDYIVPLIILAVIVAGIIKKTSREPQRVLKQHRQFSPRSSAL